MKPASRFSSPRLTAACAILGLSILTSTFARGDISTSTALTGGGGMPNEGGQVADVDTSSGTGRTSVAFALPSARGDVTPSLGIGYNSAAGDGEAGMGWSLSLPSIRRVRNNDAFTLAPTSDTHASVYSFPGPNDRFEWNGSPLVQVCVAVTAGCAGDEPFTDDKLGTRYFRLKNDTVFARFFYRDGQSHDGPGGWIVEYKSGRTEYYGSSATESAVRGLTQTGVKWRLSQVFDAHRANVVHYLWRNTPMAVDGSFVQGRRGLKYLSDIYYTPSGLASGSNIGVEAYSPGANYETHVHLAWEEPDFPQQHYAPVWLATPDLRLARVDIASKAGKSDQITKPRQLVRRYHLRYLVHNTNGKPQGAGGPLSDYRHGIDGPLRGHSFLWQVQLEGRCDSPPEEGSENEDIPGTFPVATGCPLFPPTTFEYSPRATVMPFLPLESAAHPRANATGSDGRQNLVFRRNDRLTVADVDRDGRPDFVEGWWKVFRNQGSAGILPPEFVEDCVETPGLPPAPFSNPLLDPPLWRPFLHGSDGLTLQSVYGFQGEGLSFLWRNNEPIPGGADTTRPGYTWGAANLRPKPGACTAAYGGHARNSWQFVPANSGLPGQGLPPFPQTAVAPVRQRDGVLLVGDVDGDGLPDGYVRSQDATGGVNVIRYSRRNLGTERRISPLAERVTTNLEVARLNCAAAGCTGAFFDENGTPFTIQANAPAPAYENVFRAIVDMNGDGVGDFVTSTLMRNPAPIDSSTGGYVRDVHFGYMAGNGQGKFECSPTKLPYSPLPQCSMDLGLRRVVSPTVDGPVAMPMLLNGTAAFPIWRGRSGFPHRPVFLADLNADGFADVIVARQKEHFEAPPYPGKFVSDNEIAFGIYINDAGFGFHRYCADDPTGATCSDATDPRVVETNQPGLGLGNVKITFADTRARGVNDIVIVAETSVYTLGFGSMDQAKPGLLTKIKNGLGATTELSYQTYQQHSLQFEPKEENKLEVVRHVVTQRKVSNGLTGAQGQSTTFNYSYRLPAYDPWARAFLGFRQVISSRAGGATQVANFRYHPCYLRDGCASTSEYVATPPQLPEWVTTYAANPVGLDGAIRPDVPALSTIVYHYTNRRLMPSADPRSVSSTYLSERLVFLFDTAAAPTGGSYTAAVQTTEGIEETTTETRDIPLWSTDGMKVLRFTQHMDLHGNVDHATDHGQVGADMSPIDEPITTDRTFSVRSVVHSAGTPTTSAKGHGWIWRVATSDLSAPGHLPRQEMYEYKEADLERRLGYLATQGGLNRRNPAGATAPNPVGSSVDGWKVRAEYRRDPFGNVTKALGPVFAATTGDRRICETTSFDGGYSHYPTLSAHPLDGCTAAGAASGAEVAVSQNWDRGFGIPVAVLGSGTLSTVELDAFGRPTKVFDSSASLPFTVEVEPRARVEYFDAEPISRVEGYVRDPQGAISHKRRTFAYMDGLGTPLMSLAAHENGAYVASGVTERTSSGLVAVAYEPFLYSGDTTNPSFAPPTATNRVVIGHDWFDRPITVADGYGASAKQVGRTDYKPLEVTEWDAEDLLVGGTHQGTPGNAVMDGHGRVKWAHAVRKVSGGALEHTYTQYSYLPSGEVWFAARGSLEGMTATYRSRNFDSFGRMANQAEPNSTNGTHQWSYVYNDADMLVGTSDARGCGQNLHYDGSGRKKATDLSPCLESHPGYTEPNLVTGDGTESFQWYDSPPPGEPAAAYGNALALPGRLLASFDRGAATRFSYDLRGRSTGVRRRIVRPGAPAESLAARYTDHTFEAGTAYDANDRPIAETTGADVAELMGGDGLARVTFAYGVRGQLSELGSSYGQILSQASYRVDGKPSQMVYGDAAATTVSFTYAPTLSADLEEVKVERAGSPTWAIAPLPSSLEPTQQPLLAKTRYTHDAVGNVKTITEDIPHAQWPVGAKPSTKSVTYDDFYRVTGVTTDFAGGALGHDEQKSPFQREASATRAVPRALVGVRKRSETLEYDYLGNITRSEDDTSTRYDRSLGVEVGEPGIPERLSSAEGVSVHYDEAGNMVDLLVQRPGTCEASRPCNQRFVYDWDEVGQLARARRWDYSQVIPAVTPVYPEIPEGPEWDLQYAYSGGQRTLKTAKTPGEDATHTLEVFGSLRVNQTSYENGEYVRDASHETVYLAGGARVVYGSAALPMASAGQTRLFLQVGDHLGSTSLVIDHATGELVEKVSYDAFGNVDSDYRPERWDGFREDLRFTGKEEDIEVGLTYFGARYLHTKLRRWISPDPLTIHGWGADPNPYAYVGGNAMNAVDPWGLELKEVHEHGPGKWSWLNEKGGIEVGETDPRLAQAAPAAEREPGPRQPSRWSLFAAAIAPTTLFHGLRPPATAVDGQVNMGGLQASVAGGGQELLLEGSKAAQAGTIVGELGVVTGLGAIVLGPAALGAIRTLAGGAQNASLSLAAQSPKLVTAAGIVKAVAAGVNGQDISGATAGSVRNINFTAGRSNCVACALATDATLGGSPASAVAGGPFSLQDITKAFPGRTFFPVTGYDGIRTIMGRWGAGSRGIVWGLRPNQNVGHVFNVANQGGAIRFIDGQTGGSANMELFTGYYLIRTN